MNLTYARARKPYDRYFESRHQDKDIFDTFVCAMMKCTVSFGARSLRYLAIELLDGNHLRTDQWHWYFRKSSRLEHVRLTHKDFLYFCQALAEPLSPHLCGEDDSTQFLPSLLSFSVWDADSEYFNGRYVRKKSLEFLRQYVHARFERLQSAQPSIPLDTAVLRLTLCFEDYHTRLTAPMRVKRWINDLQEIPGVVITHLDRSSVTGQR